MEKKKCFVRLTPLDDPSAFGPRLREARLAAGKSLREVAFPGCSPSYISRLENGTRVPSLQLVNALAQRLGVTPEWLLTGEVELPLEEKLRDPLFRAHWAIDELEPLLEEIAEIYHSFPEEPLLLPVLFDERAGLAVRAAFNHSPEDLLGLWELAQQKRSADQPESA